MYFNHVFLHVAFSSVKHILLFPDGGKESAKDIAHGDGMSYLYASGLFELNFPLSELQY